MTNREIRIDNKPVTIQLKYCKVEQVLLTPVCLLAGIEMKGSIPEDEFEAIKNELYRILQGISHKARDHDLMRPMVGWVKIAPPAKKMIEAVTKWEADQEWHQGDFLLYVQPSDSDEAGDRTHIIEELKNPEPDMFAIRWDKSQTARQFLKQFGEKHSHAFSDEQKELFDRVDRVISRDAAQIDVIKRDIEISLERWRDTVLSRAEKAGGLP